jgi:hypothetical protein
VRTYPCTHQLYGNCILCDTNERREHMSVDTERFKNALQKFKDAACMLDQAWQAGRGGSIENYPSYLPSFDQFVTDLLAMRLHQPPLPELPAVGTILRARHHLDCGGQARWPAGWTGEIVAFDGEYAHVQAHRYIAGLSEWDNCRTISVEDGVNACENRYGYAPDETTPRDRLVALALLAEFEVC